MDILQIIICFTIYFNFSYLNILLTTIFYHLFMYYKANRLLLMENPHIFNVFFLFLILSYDALCIYFRLGLFYLMSNPIFEYYYNKLHNLNTYFLEIKNEAITYILIKKKILINYLFPVEKEKKIIKKIITDEDALLFLNSLKTK